MSFLGSDSYLRGRPKTFVIALCHNLPTYSTITMYIHSMVKSGIEENSPTGSNNQGKHQNNLAASLIYPLKGAGQYPSLLIVRFQN